MAVKRNFHFAKQIEDVKKVKEVLIYRLTTFYLAKNAVESEKTKNSFSIHRFWKRRKKI